jgi:CheY-like chemotaxis protein
MPAKVLIADDDEKFRAVIETGLKGAYEVLSAADGQIGVQMATKHLPQVILVDVIMPKLAGIEMLRALQSDMDTRSIPCIIMSASHATPATQELFAQESNFFAFLAKPFQIPDLKAKIEEAIASTPK